MASKKLPQDGRAILQKSGVSSLPDNPSKSGFSATQIKGAMNRQSLLLYDWLDGVDNAVKGIEDIMENQVTDVKVNNQTIVENHVASLSFDDGMSVSNNTVRLSFGGLPEIAPKTLLPSQQEEVILVGERNGVISKINLGKLDYTRLKVQEEEDLTQVSINDFLFVKEN